MYYNFNQQYFSSEENWRKCWEKYNETKKLYDASRERLFGKSIV